MLHGGLSGQRDRAPAVPVRGNSPEPVALTLHLGMGTQMSVSRHPQAIHCMMRDAPDIAMPPFWELEDLIAQGLDRATALALMAARRSGPCLVPSGPNPVCLAPRADPAAPAMSDVRRRSLG